MAKRRRGRQPGGSCCRPDSQMPFPEFPSRRHQIKDIRPNLRRIRIPALFPVAVDLPLGPDKLMIGGFRPVVNRLVGGPKAAVWTQMRDPRDRAGRRRRAHDLASLAECSLQFDTHFEADGVVPVDGNVATCLRVLRTCRVPYQATTLRHDARQLRCACLSSKDREWNARELLKVYFVHVADWNTTTHSRCRPVFAPPDSSSLDQDSLSNCLLFKRQQERNNGELLYGRECRHQPIVSAGAAFRRCRHVLRRALLLGRRLPRFDVCNPRRRTRGPLHRIRQDDDAGRGQRLLVDKRQLRRTAWLPERNASAYQYRHHRDFDSVYLAGVEQRPKQGAAAKKPDVAPWCLLQLRHNFGRIVVDNANARMCGGRQRPRENNHLETWHGTVPALRGHHFVRLAPDDDDVEFLVERGEVDRWIGNDPVELAVWSGDEAVEADGNLVTHTSLHAFSPLAIECLAVNLGRGP